MKQAENSRSPCHPATAIVLWLFFMTTASSVGGSGLIVLTIVVLGGMTNGGLRQFVRYVRRSRWLLLVLLLVHAYSIPGTRMFTGLGPLGPSQSGLYDAMTQIWRLLLILASLAILMTQLTRTALLSGFYRLFTPLRWLGVPPERLAVRIWLTLGYAEDFLNDARRLDFRQRMERLFRLPALDAERMQPLVLSEKSFDWVDYMCILAAVSAGIWLRNC